MSFPSTVSTNNELGAQDVKGHIVIHEVTSGERQKPRAPLRLAAGEQ